MKPHTPPPLLPVRHIKPVIKQVLNQKPLMKQVVITEYLKQVDVSNVSEDKPDKDHLLRVLKSSFHNEKEYLEAYNKTCDLEKQQVLVIVLNPLRGVKWQYSKNWDLERHVGDCGLYWQHFVLTEDGLKGRSVSAYFEHEVGILRDHCDQTRLWDEVTSNIYFYTSFRPRGIKFCCTLTDLENNDVDLPTKRLVHQLFVRLHKSVQRRVNNHKAFFSYGSHTLGQDYEFTIPKPDPISIHCVKRHRAPGGRFSPYALADRQRLYGHPALRMEMIERVSAPLYTPAYFEWRDKLSADENLTKLFKYQYKLITELEQACDDDHLVPLRGSWEEVFSHRCHNIGEVCGTCRNCDKRFAQAAIVVFAAQGVADSNILCYLGTVFRHWRYQNWGVAEWALVNVYELATILKPCSAQGLKSLYLKHFFQYLSQHQVPRTVPHFCCFYGIQKKSACLLISTTKEEPVGIPVDRHLKAAFRNLGWVPPEVNDPTLMSEMVEIWLPADQTADVNNKIAGIRQLYQKSTTRASLCKTAFNLGEEHYEILKYLVKDISVPWDSLQGPSTWLKWKYDESESNCLQGTYAT
jgi:endonuclease III